MQLRITIREEESPVTIQNAVQLNEVLRSASEQARTRKMLGAILLEADNGNVMTMVVGGEETVLGFDYDGPDGLNYASKGPCKDDEPIMTCFLHFSAPYGVSP
jgi:hypothetical protein